MNETEPRSSNTNNEPVETKRKVTMMQKTAILSILLGGVAALAMTTWSGHGAAAPRADATVATVSGDPFNVKTEVIGDCKVGSECTAKITISVIADEYHVNDQYPFKFTADAIPNVEHHGAGGNVYQAADFVREKKTATMTVHFKPSAKGNVTLTGKYKICVCSDKTCEPRVIDVAIPVLVK